MWVRFFPECHSSSCVRETSLVCYSQFVFLLQTVVGADIADLLLEGHEPSSLDYSRHGMRITRSREDLLDDSSAVATTTGVNRSVIGGGSDLSIDDVTDRFRNLLLHGQKKVCFSCVRFVLESSLPLIQPTFLQTQSGLRGNHL